MTLWETTDAHRSLFTKPGSFIVSALSAGEALFKPDAAKDCNSVGFSAVLANWFGDPLRLAKPARVVSELGTLS
jgi:hypothetical protein